MKKYDYNSCGNCAIIFLAERHFIKKKLALFCSNKCQKNYINLNKNKPGFNLPKVKLYYPVNISQLNPEEHLEYCYSDANWSSSDVKL